MSSNCVNITGWAKIRKAILNRDNHQCRICAKDFDLHVHHIDYNRLNNKDSNLVALCTSCHRAIHMENYKPCEHEDWPAPWDKTARRDEFNQEYSW